MQNPVLLTYINWKCSKIFWNRAIHKPLRYNYPLLCKSSFLIILFYTYMCAIALSIPMKKQMCSLPTQRKKKKNLIPNMSRLHLKWARFLASSDEIYCGNTLGLPAGVHAQIFSLETGRVSVDGKLHRQILSYRESTSSGQVSRSGNWEGFPDSKVQTQPWRARVWLPSPLMFMLWVSKRVWKQIRKSPPLSFFIKALFQEGRRIVNTGVKSLQIPALRSSWINLIRNQKQGPR